MPSKSRRNRRQISQTRRGTLSNVAAGQAAMQPAAGQPENVPASYNTANISAKAVNPAAPMQNYFLSEAKWIGIVTAFIIILLVASYFVFR
jgi:hypothetical protein